MSSGGREGTLLILTPACQPHRRPRRHFADPGLTSRCAGSRRPFRHFAYPGPRQPGRHPIVRHQVTRQPLTTVQLLHLSASAGCSLNGLHVSSSSNPEEHQWLTVHPMHLSPQRILCTAYGFSGLNASLIRPPHFAFHGPPQDMLSLRTRYCILSPDNGLVPISARLSFVFTFINLNLLLRTPSCNHKC